MTERQRENPSIPLQFPTFLRAPVKNARGPMLIIAGQNKAHFQKGLASVTQLFQLT